MSKGEVLEWRIVIGLKRTDVSRSSISERYPVRRNEKLRFEISGVRRPEGDLDR
jgi:hypothetical protein